MKPARFPVRLAILPGADLVGTVRIFDVRPDGRAVVGIEATTPSGVPYHKRTTLTADELEALTGLQVAS